MKTIQQVKDEESLDVHNKLFNELTPEEKGTMVDIVATAYAMEHVKDTFSRNMKALESLNTK